MRRLSLLALLLAATCATSAPAPMPKTHNKPARTEKPAAPALAPDAGGGRLVVLKVAMHKLPMPAPPRPAAEGRPAGL